MRYRRVVATAAASQLLTNEPVSSFWVALPVCPTDRGTRSFTPAPTTRYYLQKTTEGEGRAHYTTAVQLKRGGSKDDPVSPDALAAAREVAKAEDSDWYRQFIGEEAADEEESDTDGIDGANGAIDDEEGEDAGIYSRTDRRSGRASTSRMGSSRISSDTGRQRKDAYYRDEDFGDDGYYATVQEENDGGYEGDYEADEPEGSNSASKADRDRNRGSRRPASPPPQVVKQPAMRRSTAREGRATNTYNNRESVGRGSTRAGTERWPEVVEDDDGGDNEEWSRRQRGGGGGVVEADRGVAGGGSSRKRSSSGREGRTGGGKTSDSRGSSSGSSSSDGGSDSRVMDPAVLSELSSLGYTEDEATRLTAEIVDLIMAAKVTKPMYGIPEDWFTRPALTFEQGAYMEEEEDYYYEDEGEGSRRQFDDTYYDDDDDDDDDLYYEDEDEAYYDEGDAAAGRYADGYGDDEDADYYDEGGRSSSRGGKNSNSKKKKKKLNANPIARFFDSLKLSDEGDDYGYEEDAKGDKPLVQWPSLPDFKGMLRKEAEMRLDILGPWAADIVAAENQFRLKAYDGWLRALDEGIGEDLFSGDASEEGWEEEDGRQGGEGGGGGRGGGGRGSGRDDIGVDDFLNGSMESLRGKFKGVVRDTDRDGGGSDGGRRKESRGRERGPPSAAAAAAAESGRARDGASGRSRGGGAAAAAGGSSGRYYDDDVVEFTDDDLGLNLYDRPEKQTKKKTRR